MTDEWYTDEETVKKCFDLLNAKHGSTVLLPFDTEKSAFVRIALERGLVPIYGIKDFIEGEQYDCDFICTNPPFSIKNQVIEKCFQYGKKSVLVMPLDVIGGLARRKLFQEYELPKVWLPAGRISYFDKDWIKRPSSNFHSVILTLNHGESPSLDWEQL
jgi:hypothetical protein